MQIVVLTKNQFYAAFQNHPNFEIIVPPYLFDTSGSLATRPVIVSAPTTFSPSGTLSVTVDTDSVHTFSLIRLGAATHSVNLDQRRIPLPVAQQLGQSFTLQIPVSPAHVPPGVYWLFAMNAAEVPSIGHTMIRTL